MVHRANDSRLLANLIKSDKELESSFHTLLANSRASIASLQAYASSCSATTSRTIFAVTSAFLNADEALNRYAASIDAWSDLLQEIMTLEDEVGIVVRDREILVTQLIKASKQKGNRDSVLLPSGAGYSGTQAGSKLRYAQTELQACEAYLATKENELEILRRSAIKNGLEGRCRALIECGVIWTDNGRAGSGALEELAHTANGQVSSSFYKPLPDPSQSQHQSHSHMNGYGSDVSLAPSQSASQVALDSLKHGSANLRSSSPSRPHSPYSLRIPPAHAIDDGALPVPSDEDETGSSSGSELENVEVHENTFPPSPISASAALSRNNTITQRNANNTLRSKKQPANSNNGPPRQSSLMYVPEIIAPVRAAHSDLGPQSRGRGTTTRSTRSQVSNGSSNNGGRSSSLLGAIAGFFRGPRSKDKRRGSDATSDLVGSYSGGGGSGKWQTRTDNNIAKTSKKRGGGDSSSDDEPTTGFLTVDNRQGGGSNVQRGASVSKPPTIQPPRVLRSDSVRKKEKGKRLTKNVTGSETKLGEEGGKVSRSGTVKSTKSDGTVRRRAASEAKPPIPRGAPTATSPPASPAPSKASLPNGDVDDSGKKSKKRHSRTASGGNTSSNLMVLVEQPTAVPPVPPLPSPKLQTIQAPGSVIPGANMSLPTAPPSVLIHSPTPTKQPLPKPIEVPLSPTMALTKHNARTHTPNTSTSTISPLPTIRPKSPATPTTTAYVLSSATGVTHHPVPLRSALRNPSPSPNSTPTASPPPPLQQRKKTVPPPSSSAAAIAAAAEDSGSDDTSYETGREDAASISERRRSAEISRFVPPSTSRAVAKSPRPAAPTDLSVSSNSTGAMNGSGAVGDSSTSGRRKSVRMALPPSIPSTPMTEATTSLAIPNTRSREPATHIAYPGVTPTAEREEWVSRIGNGNGGNAMWEDSSDEDVSYKQARAALDKAQKSFEEAGGVVAGKRERKKSTSKGGKEKRQSLKR